MYSRSYLVEYSPEQKETFLQIVKDSIDANWYYEHLNNYPYDRNDKENRHAHGVIHITARANKIEDLDGLVEHYVSEWYHPHPNKKKDQSIPEIPHMHFIKET